MINYIQSAIRMALVVFLLGALSCKDNDTPDDGTGVSNTGNSDSNSSSSSKSVEIDTLHRLDSTGTPAIQIPATDGNGPIHTGSQDTKQSNGNTTPANGKNNNPK